MWTAQILGIRPVAVVAHREVQLAVRSEPDAPADVQQLGRRGGPEQLERTVRADVLRRVEPDQVVQQVVPGVVEVDVVVGHTEVGVERDADQPAVAGVLRRQVGERGRQELPVLDDLDLPAALEDEDPPVRCDLETGRTVRGHHRSPVRSGSRQAARPPLAGRTRARASQAPRSPGVLQATSDVGHVLQWPDSS